MDSKSEAIVKEAHAANQDLRERLAEYLHRLHLRNLNVVYFKMSEEAKAVLCSEADNIIQIWSEWEQEQPWLL